MSTDIDTSNFGKPAGAVIDTDRFLYSMAKFMLEGGEREEAQMVLQCDLEAQTTREQYYGEWAIVLDLTFRGPRKVYDALAARDFGSTAEVFERAAEALRPPGVDHVRVARGVALTTAVSADWRNELLAVIEGRDVDNQAVGFTSVTTWEGLRFRSQSEAKIARVLDRIPGVMYLPNCRGRIGSKDQRRNLEADFVVMFGGVWGVLEVDGPHHEGKAARDHDRDRPFYYHGAAIVQRYESLRCFHDPDAVVLNFMTLLKQKAKM